MAVHLKRVYDPPATKDGMRVLVDRVWPRGMTKAAAHIDEWLKELGPSTELRKWFNHDLQRWEEFRSKYHAELRAAEQRERLDHLRQIAGKRKSLTLVYGARTPSTTRPSSSPKSWGCNDGSNEYSLDPPRDHRSSPYRAGPQG